MPKKKFSALLEAAPRGGCFIAIPFDIEKAFGTRGRVKVRATFDGISYRGSIAPMGGRHVLGVLKDIRAKLGKEAGDHVAVVLEQDTEVRLFEVPPELDQAFRKKPVLRRVFDSLSYTRRRETAQFIAGAKKEETRQRRVEKVLDELAHIKHTS